MALISVVNAMRAFVSVLRLCRKGQQRFFRKQMSKSRFLNIARDRSMLSWPRISWAAGSPYLIEQRRATRENF